VGVVFQLPLWVRDRLRPRLASTVLAVASLALTPAVQAQSFTWGGAGSSTATTDYNLNTNWGPTAGAPPIAGGQSAIFDTSGTSSVNVNAGPIAPYSWIFDAAAQSYTISGQDVNFSLAGAAGGIIDNGNLGHTISISNNIGDGIGGAVQVQLLGASTLQLSGINTYSGGTTVSNGGTLQVLNNSSVGTGTVTLQHGLFQANAGALTFTNSFRIDNTPSGSAIDANGATLTIAGNITDGVGAGQLTVLDNSFAHTGVVVLTGTSTYTGGTTICFCGTLQLGVASHTASIVGAVSNFGALNIVNANTSGITSITNDRLLPSLGVTTFLNATSAGTMTITNQNGGQTNFGTHLGGDTATAGNAVIVNNSTSVTTFFASTTAGNATITNQGLNASTLFYESSNAGNATIVNRGSNAITVFYDSSDARNANITTMNGGGTIFTGSSSAGSAIITTMSGGGTAFVDFSNGGNAQFITDGIVDFSGTSGLGPVPPLGLNQITAGSIAGSGTYIIGGSNLLTVGSNNLSTEVSGAIGGVCGCDSGSLEKVGTGTLTLSGTNTYTGLTLVNGGTLLVTGSIASSGLVLVDNGATLGGTGTVAPTFLNGAATLAPGLPTALGTLTVNDELVFCNCTFYNVKVTSGGNDLTQVVSTGGPAIAALDGTVRATSLNSSYKFNSPYTILTAQGGFDAGFGPTQFSSLVTPAGINGSLSYTLTEVNLMLLSALGQLPGLNVNQHNVANALDTVFNASGTSGALGAIFNGNIPFNLSQASGETATGSQQATFNAMDLFLGLLTDPFIDGRGGSNPSSGGAPGFAAEGDSASAYAARKQNPARDAFAKIPTKADVARNNLLDPHWSVWGAAYGGGSSTDGNAALGSNNSTARAFGFAAGADYRLSPATLVGFALAGGGTNFSVNGFGSGRSDLFQAGAFVRHTIGAAYVSGALAYGWQDVTTDRTVTIAGLDRLHAQFNANAISGRVEAGYRYATPWMGITPYAAGQFTIYSLPAYAEQALVGSNAFALNYAAKDVTASRTELGLRSDRSFAMQNAILTLRGRAAWAHDFNTDRNIAAVFQTLPGASFVVNGAAQAHDSALTTVSVEAKWLNGWSAAATFEGEFSSVTRSYAGKGVVRYIW
jgi:autotransporter-associated beta strand protein